MIEIKKGVLERIKNWDDETIYVLADFDRTITVGDSEGSWSILSKSDKVPDGYKKEAKEIYDYYRPIEVDETLDENVKNKFM